MDLEHIRQLLELFGRSRLQELTLTEGDTTIRVLRGEAAAAAPAAVPAQTQAGHAVASPMFGIVHKSPNPGAAPFVKVGDTVAEGQPICTIEAMKVFNLVAADRAGTVARILFEDGGEVEAGQPLVEFA
ncbi:acetyl-CoA carboxylase biotin carboxyl carrier protein [Falsirhodobacter sp. 1013]|uniref:acetyl-CoA carboxylase biotin carboxyl carrier protein n=1 Tax=Falsirhodobacter sp. 1013 TaxID=3417566 RepID=UPI003EBA626D